VREGELRPRTGGVTALDPAYSSVARSPQGRRDVARSGRPDPAGTPERGWVEWQGSQVHHNP